MFWRTLPIAALSLACTAAPANAPSGESATDGASTDASIDASGPPVFQIGGAKDDGTGFVDWSGGTSTAPIITGIQGGQHVWVSVRTRNIPVHKAHLLIKLARPADCSALEAGETEWRVPLVTQDDWKGYSGLTAYVSKPCEVQGKPVHVKVQLKDEDTLLAEADAFVTPTWDGVCP